MSNDFSLIELLKTAHSPFAVCTCPVTNWLYIEWKGVHKGWLTIFTGSKGYYITPDESLEVVDPHSLVHGVPHMLQSGGTCLDDSEIKALPTAAIKLIKNV